jgi:long-chain acyl-CoA synthetase
MDLISYQSIPAILRENAGKFGAKTAISYKKKGVYTSLTYAEFYERVLLLARGLGKAGVQPGDKVAIFSENRLGWAISDFGIQAARGITVPIYATNTGKQAAYVINHSEAKVVFVSTKGQYEKLLAIKDKIPNVELVVSYERFMGCRTFPVYSQYQLSDIEAPLTPAEKETIEKQIDSIRHEDIITIIYTSGTTGVPKGVLLTQYNILYDCEYGMRQLGGMGNNETFLSFLPLSHVLERTGGYYAALLSGNHIAFAEDAKKVLDNMVEIRPTVMVSVPRLFEKIHSRIYDSVHQASPFKRNLFHYAVKVGSRYIQARYIDKKPVGLLGLQYRFFDRLVFSKVRDRFGGRLKYFICGGAPLDKTINEFMWILGMPVFNGYGLTETSPAATLCSLDEVRFDSVGKAFYGVELKLAEDGELLIRGPIVMQGYYKNPEATRETIEDGWLKTGDIATIDKDGFVYIIDRKKELIVTAGGKNIAPQPLENDLRLDKYISQAIVFGDRKPYLVALVTPDIERLLDFTKEEKIEYLDIDELVKSDKIKALFEARIAAINKQLPPYKTIKHFALIATDFSIEGGELTPTLKLKRKEIHKKYREIVEELYVQNGSSLVFQPKPIHGE